MGGITLLEERVVKVEEDEVKAPVAVFLQPKVEMEEDAEKQEDSVAVDPLAGCEEWNEMEPLAESFLMSVKKEEADAGTSNERSERAVSEEVKDDAEGDSGSNRAEPPNEERRSSRQFTARTTLVQRTRVHMNEAEKTTNFSCETCGKEFKRQCYLKKHLHVHTGEKPYVCDQCGKSFIYRSNLIVHLRQHTGERPYSCSICNQRFVNIAPLLCHKRRHLNIKPFKCKECAKTFVENGDYARHLRIHTGERPYKCSICSKTFIEKGNLNRHMFTHSRDPKQMSQCEVCSESFKTTYMISHMRTHTRERAFKCGYCEKTFAQSTNRKKHEKTHTRVYLYNCAECGRGYCKKRLLVRHIQTHKN